MSKEAVKMEQEEEQKEETKAKGGLVVLFVDLHCSGCAKKIEKCVMRIRGVEEVGIDMAKNEMSIKGIVDDPQAICAKITKKTNRLAKLLPLLQPQPQPQPQALLRVVELNVSMHCEACAHQLKKKILKMRGVQTASTELSTGKVVVTGTMDENKLVEYVYRRTKKQAKIVPQPQPQPQEEAAPQPQENKQDQPPPKAPPQDQPPQEPELIKTESTTNNNKEEEQPQPQPQPPLTTTVVEDVEEAKPAPTPAPAEGGDQMMENKPDHDHENMKRMMMYQPYYQYHPLYAIQPITPPPQLFSDENPNACCIL